MSKINLDYGTPPPVEYLELDLGRGYALKMERNPMVEVADDLGSVGSFWIADIWPDDGLPVAMKTIFDQDESSAWLKAQEWCEEIAYALPDRK